MTKRLLLTVTMCLCVMLICTAQMVGSWQHLNSYGGTPSKIIDTPDRVFVVSQNRLTVYDKSSDELMVYSVDNYLTDSKVRDVFYNFDKRYAAVVYENGNVDIVYDNGRVKNMPEIRDMELNTEKRIRDISFYGDRMYMACEFGMVVMDVEKQCVIESVMTENPLIAAFVLGDMLIICDTSYKVFKSPVSTKHYSMSQFVIPATGGGHDAVAVIDSHRYYSVEGAELFLFEFDNEYYNYSRKKFPLSNITSKFIPLKDGGFFIYSNDRMAFCDKDGNVTMTEIPDAMKSNPVGCYSGTDDMWTATESGLARFSYDPATAQLTTMMNPSRPKGLSCGNVGQILKGSKGLYVASLGPSNPYNINQNDRSYIDYRPYGSSDFINIYPETLPHTNKFFPAPLNLMHSNYHLAEVPGEPETFLVGNFFEGIYKMNVKGEVLGKYDYTNSTINLRSGEYLNGVADQAFDREGNLWVIAFGSTHPVFHMLPASKFKNGDTTASDWNICNVGEFQGQKDARILICKRSNMIFITGMYGILGYDTKGTLSDLNDDEYSYRIKLTDQDGLSLESTYYIPMAEDQNGRVWIGHDGGLIEITNPSTFNRSDFHINRIKVPRNDGTSLADYLLEGMRITSIAVDASNRKWIGTNISGLYLVNENGSEVLAHFTTENSNIPSDCVYEVSCDNSSNHVYVGTDVGLAVYAADAAPAAEDYSDIYAYPNPVRPEYTGLITVAGLMDNSLVKIADAAGNVFFTGRSEGGMITWDGCNGSGQRVKTGVYFVYASQSDGSQSSGAVTKILVVN